MPPAAFESPIDVDMVPLIDIVVLILLFLIITGAMARSSASVPMKLPRADQALTDNLPSNMFGRIVIQLVPLDGKYVAVIENNRFEFGSTPARGTLAPYLNQVLDRRGTPRGEHGEVGTPVKLRIPEAAPMEEVE